MNGQLIFAFVFLVFCNSVYSQEKESITDSTTNDNFLYFKNNQHVNKNITVYLESLPGLLLENGIPGFTDFAEIGVRGGIGNGTKYIIDGIPFNNLFYGGLKGSIPFYAIERIDNYQGVYGVNFGNASSGIINIITRNGSDKYFGGAEIINSSFTDKFVHEKYSGYFGEPLIVENPNLNIFGAVEYLKSDDNNPKTINLQIPTANINSNILPENESEDTRLYVKFSGKYADINAQLSFLGSKRLGREYIHKYAKNNSIHNPKINENIFGGSFKLSHTTESTGNFRLGFRYLTNDYKKGDGIWFDNLEAYGDSAKNAELGVTFFNGDGTTLRTDENGIFYMHGRIFDYFQKYQTQTWGMDFDYEFQYLIHSFKMGISYAQSKLRYYEINPVGISRGYNYTINEKYFYNLGRNFGYDIFGKIYDGGDQYLFLNTNDMVFQNLYEQTAAKKPITQYAYLEDIIKLNNLLISLGVRYDYFNPNTKRIKNLGEFLGEDGIVTPEDFEQSPSQNYFSPRLKTIYDISRTTNVFAGYGIFYRQPEFTDVYDSWNNYENLESGQSEFSTGYVNYEKMTQIEWGISQNVEGYGNINAVYFQNTTTDIAQRALIETIFGESLKDFYTPINNKENVTVKGVILNINYWYEKVFNIHSNYLYASSNMMGSELLDNYLYRLIFNKYSEWKTRQSLSFNINLRMENLYNLNSFYSVIFKNTNLSLFTIYNYDTRFSQLKYVDLRQNYFLRDFADRLTKTRCLEYLRIDMSFEKEIKIGKFSIIPYLWIRNLFNKNNYNLFYMATGKPDDSGFLETPLGQRTIMSMNNGEDFISDYKALERNPANYDIPRLIRLGLKVEF